MGANQKILDALRLWKKEPDDFILGRLNEFVNENEQDVSGVMKNTIDFISYEGNDILIKSLFSVKVKDSYSFKRSIPVYNVLINETENINIPNCNMEVSFDKEEDRDESVERLKDKLKEFANIRFI